MAASFISLELKSSVDNPYLVLFVYFNPKAAM
jgi:hypothetical protein